jgi:multidrug efflux pump subunit AcrB
VDITKSALKNPTGVAIIVAIVSLLGLISLFRLPIQLFPDIEQPRISIQTFWRAASPMEIESEILEPQEEVLQGIPGLKNIQAWANKGNSWINLQFGLETDMQKTLIDVISRMNRLPPLPRDANPPVINIGGGGGDAPALTFFFLQLLPGNDGKIADYATFIEDVIRPRLESIPGVARVNAQGGFGSEEELQIVFDPYRAAELGIDISNVSSIISSSQDVSGGFVDVGRRTYTLRFAGRYEAEKLGNLILSWRDDSPIRLADIAEIQVQRGDRRDLAIQNGNPAVSIRIDRENGANALATLLAVKEQVNLLNENILRDKQLIMEQSFDASVFIYRAINLVTSNLFMGIMLAVGVLWWFLRQKRATAIVALTIPISVLSTIVFLSLADRTLNVISLAGIAFAVGMVLDAAIVVLENIVRMRQGGKDAEQASELGAKQVIGALMASTATTVAIFVPVIFLKDVEGQLFADLAITIAMAVVFSLIVAVSILPAVAKRWLAPEALTDRYQGLWKKIAGFIIGLTNTAKRRYLLTLGLMGVPIALTYLLMPQLDYLPPVKRDAVDAWFNFPAGANINFVDNEVVQPIVERLEPYMKGEKQPALKNYYILIWNGGQGGTIGVRAKDQSKVNELLEVINKEILKELPDTGTFAMQGNLFGQFGGGRNIAIQLQSKDNGALVATAERGMELLREHIEGVQVRPRPSLQQSEPELRIYPDDQRIMEVGWNRRNVANTVRSAGDGMYVGEFFDGTKRMNVIFRSEEWKTPEELESMPVSTPSGAVIQLGELVDIERTVGPSNIQRIDRRRTQVLSVNPPENMSLEEALTIIQEKVEPELQAMLPADGAINYGGSADALKKAIANMGQNFILALGLLFILMSGLFKSLKDSLLVVLTIPLATVGGVIALQLLNLVSFQTLDLLTMIGFIILLGLVVNNAILLVYQTRQSEALGMSRKEAVNSALLLRLRPIFMSTLTSIFGMLPLLLTPGAGSVIYRGMAAVIVGGMSLSTIFTLFLLPCLLRMGESSKQYHSAVSGSLATAKLNKIKD